MTGYLTRDEYETFVKLQDKFYECQKQSAIEIFVMRYNREPKGEFCGDSEVYDIDQYMVQFESYSCGECDYDTVYVPIPYLHDELYREHYGEYLENEARRQKEHKEEEKRRVEVVRAEEKEMRDLSEYERLKKKYEAIKWQ